MRLLWKLEYRLKFPIALTKNSSHKIRYSLRLPARLAAVGRVPWSRAPQILGAQISVKSNFPQQGI